MYYYLSPSSHISSYLSAIFSGLCLSDDRTHLVKRMTFNIRLTYLLSALLSRLHVLCLETIVVSTWIKYQLILYLLWVVLKVFYCWKSIKWYGQWYITTTIHINLAPTLHIMTHFWTAANWFVWLSWVVRITVWLGLTSNNGRYHPGALSLSRHFIYSLIDKVPPRKMQNQAKLGTDWK